MLVVVARAMAFAPLATSVLAVTRGGMVPARVLMVAVAHVPVMTAVVMAALAMMLLMVVVIARTLMVVLLGIGAGGRAKERRA